MDYVLMVPGMKLAFVLTADHSENQCEENLLIIYRELGDLFFPFSFVNLTGSGHLVVCL